VGPPWRQNLAVFAARLVTPGRRFPIPLDDPELFTATPRWQEYIRTDALGLRQGTARLLMQSFLLNFYLRRAARRVNVPTLLLLAGQDRIIDNARTRAFVERFPAEKEVIEYPEAHHTLEFEPDPDRYVDDVLGWLGRRPPAG
jgi:alpha-beta hydrolase superfamily lysophospholipase